LDIDNFNRDLTRAGAALALAQGAISSLLGSFDTALAVVVTTPIAIWWLRSTASAVLGFLSDPNLTEGAIINAEAEGSSKSWLLMAKLPLVALALTCILWYMPARPEGVALGVLNGLLAAVYAGFRHQRNSS
jgi:hypothetical protein